MKSSEITNFVVAREGAFLASDFGAPFFATVALAPDFLRATFFVPLAGAFLPAFLPAFLEFLMAVADFGTVFWASVIFLLTFLPVLTFLTLTFLLPVAVFLLTILVLVVSFFLLAAISNPHVSAKINGAFYYNLAEGANTFLKALYRRHRARHML
jgi:hypothetical protein